MGISFYCYLDLLLVISFIIIKIFCNYIFVMTTAKDFSLENKRGKICKECYELALT